MTSKRKIAFLSIVLALTCGSGAPAIGDDTELLLVTPVIDAKPNILFILDTSGSMNSKERTVAFYDSTLTYTGVCDNSRLYWTDSGSVPACTSNDRTINKTAFVCDGASRQVDAIGSYMGILAQYRIEGAGGAKWQTIQENESIAIVECEKDSGSHGDGIPALVHAQAGTAVAEFTADPAREVDWGSAPVHQTYTLYDGNYLNYRAAAPAADIKRIDIVKTALSKVLTGYDDVNLGLMRFNNVDGGVVLQAVADISTSAAAIDTFLAGISGVANTPLSETAYEAALYWRGMPAHYGELIEESVTDPDALVSLVPEIYRAPPTVGGTCARNFNIILSDGLPKNDADTKLLAPTLPGFEVALGRTACDDYVDDGDCLDDITEYLSRYDINSTAPGDQLVKTYTVGFLADLPILKESAEISGGEYYLANDPEGLVVSLLAILDEITEQSLTFAAPAVAVNAFNRTQNLNDMYMTVFRSKAQTHWPGNLKKYRLVDRVIMDADGMPAVDPATGFFNENARSFWTVGGPDGAEAELGGAAGLLPDPSTRKLYTYNGSDTNLTGGSNELTPSNAAAFTVSDFGLTGAATEPTIDEIIRWARGEDILDDDLDPSTLVRNVMGDPLHSQPAAIDYGTAGGSDVVVYVATNDGYLHAIDAATGVELWSFIPKELLSDLHRLYVDPASRYKHYGIDGDIVSVVSDQNGNGEIDGTDFIYIVFGMRRGGNNYYALDVTDKNTPKLLWNVTLPEFGQSWSAPVVTRIDTTAAGLNAGKAVVVIGAGYDTVHDSVAAPVSDDGEGAGIFMLDLQTGNTIWRAGRDSAANLQLSTMTRAFPTRIKVIDIDGNGFADRMYAADVGGQIWRFDIFSGQAPSNLVTGGVIASFGLEATASSTGPDVRRIYNSPDLSLFTDQKQARRYIAVSIGTGYRAHPLDQNAADRFYSLRDPDVFNSLTQSEYDSYVVATDADMLEVSGQLGVILNAGDRGWKFTLPASQKVLADSITFDDSIYFVSFAPEASAIVACGQRVGRNFLYRVNVANGDPVVNNIDALDPALADAERVTELQQGGIAPAPTILFPGPDPGCTGVSCSPRPLGCVGVECFDPGFANNPVRTLWTQDGIE